MVEFCLKGCYKRVSGGISKLKGHTDEILPDWTGNRDPLSPSFD